ncbi:ABC transporter permease [uncultured Dysosmobacter sp.]|uniref:ABC transporter permease n=1 Tax=uncultured Dysosmobacter sp. TaxID=2591384 RepID=UPI00267338F5|nr:ABC transporter permease [uncultured Dysosmobacter sp.]
MDNRPVQLEKHPVREFYQRNNKVLNTLLMCILVFILGEIIIGAVMGTHGTFLSVSQVFLTIRLAAFVALFGLCQQLVICVGGGGLDLSVGYIATLSGIVAGHLMNGSNAGILPSVLTALVIGAFFGLCNGLLTAYLNLPSLVVTMAMANIVQGIVNAYVSKVAIEGNAAPALQWLTAKFTGIFPNILIVVILVTVVMVVIFRRTSLGVRILGVGANENTAYLSGVNVKRVRCLAFVVSGILAALIGLLLLGYLGHASKDMASNYVMPSIVAVVVGGISINGGEGNYLSVVLGAVVLQSLTNLFVALGWGDAGKWLGYGLILLIMLAAYIRNKRKR